MDRTGCGQYTESNETPCYRKSRVCFTFYCDMKLIYVKNLASKRISSFEKSAMEAASKLGFEITFACNTRYIDTNLMEQDCKKYGIQLKHIDFERSPYSLKNICAYRQLLNLMTQEKYDIAHCNTPIGGVVGRLAAHKAKIPYTIYQAHGFHFWKGAPCFNWLCYYPVERLLARYTDLLITINQEDYQTAKKFSTKKVVLVNGVGIDTSLFVPSVDKNPTLRQNLGIPQKSFVLLSVGELINRKNNITVIEALGKLKNPHIFYVMCGEGPEQEKLYKRAIELHIDKQIIFAGFQHKVTDFYQMADAFILASFHEGIPAVTMEAMACKIPVLASHIRGHIDLLPQSHLLFNPCDSNEIALYLQNIIECYPTQEIERNFKQLDLFDYKRVVQQMQTVYNQATQGSK